MNIEWKILMNNFKIPKIRFMNFNDKWKYKILGEISSSIEYGLNASAKDFDGIHLYLRITDIDDSSRLFLTDKLSSPDVNFTEENYENYKLQKNDLLFARTGASVGKTYLYRESDGEVYYAGFLIRARLHDSYDGNFVFQQTLTDKYKQFTEITSQRSGQPGINGKEYGNWKIGMTSYSEQSAIGSLFRTLDDLLASYKDNLANYQSLKATMLSKMFPKVGQTVPEIRLDGFEGEWENKILSEITNITMGQSPKSENYTDNPNDYILVQGNADIKDKQVVPRLWTTEVTKMAEIGDIILTVRAPVGDIGKTDYNVVIGRGVAAIKGNDFIFYTLEKMKMTGFWNKFSTGSTFESISSNDIKEAIIQIPTLEEQQAIGAYFSNLDNLINSYQEKISQLETLKKKLLQDMFI